MHIVGVRLTAKKSKSCLFGTGPDQWKKLVDLGVGQGAKGRRLLVKIDIVVKGRGGGTGLVEVEGDGEEEEREGGELQDNCGMTRASASHQLIDSSFAQRDPCSYNSSIIPLRRYPG